MHRDMARMGVGPRVHAAASTATKVRQVEFVSIPASWMILKPGSSISGGVVSLTPTCAGYFGCAYLPPCGIVVDVELDLANTEVELLGERSVCVVERRFDAGSRLLQAGEHLRVRAPVVAVVRASTWI